VEPSGANVDEHKRKAVPACYRRPARSALSPGVTAAEPLPRMRYTRPHRRCSSAASSIARVRAGDGVHCPPCAMNRAVASTTARLLWSRDEARPGATTDSTRANCCFPKRFGSSRPSSSKAVTTCERNEPRRLGKATGRLPSSTHTYGRTLEPARKLFVDQKPVAILCVPDPVWRAPPARPGRAGRGIAIFRG